jgi:error-prone DNA polymerase
MGFYSPRVVLNDARRFGLPVLPLDINASFEGFSVEMVLDMSTAAGGAGAPPTPGAATVGGADAAPATPLPSAAGAPPMPATPLRPALRVGLKYVKEMSAAAMQRIVAARGDIPRDILGRPVGEPASLALPASARPYTSLTDFVERTHVSIEIAENLVRAGAFESLGTRREELLAQLPIVYACAQGERAGRARRPARDNARRRAATLPPQSPAPESRELEPPAAESPQALRLLTDQMPALDFLPSWSPQEVLRNELEVLGLNVSAHPLRFVRHELKALGVTPMARLAQVPHGRSVRLAGVLERAQMPWIRSGHRTLFLTLEDETELGQVVVFNDAYLKYGGILKDAIYLLVDGQLQNDEEHGLAVVAQQIYDLLEVVGRPAAERPSVARRGAGGHGGRSAPAVRPLAAPDALPRITAAPATAAAAGTGPSRPARENAPQPAPGAPATAPPLVPPYPASPAQGHRWGDEGSMPWVEPRTRPGRTG